MTNYVVNPLTNQPGGSRLQLIFRNGKERFQDRVKNPNKYVDKVLEKEGSNLLSVFNLTENKQVYPK